MKQTKRILSLLLAAVLLFALASCGKAAESTVSQISEAPGAATIDSTMDEATIDEYITEESVAVENSPNVNGRRFTMTLKQFTEAYNAEQSRRKNRNMITLNKWVKDGEPEKDENGVEIQYWHYNEEYVSFTASVEVKSNRIMNMGCGVTTSTFMGMTGDKNNSDIVLDKAAMMAMIICKYPAETEEILRDIFYRTTTEYLDSFWYGGFIFALSTKDDKTDSKNNVMLFRVFPISDELKKEWKPAEYVTNL